MQECLAAGCSMVVIPFGGDQLENARRVERLGVGVAVSAATMTPGSVRDALLRASSSALRDRAQAIAAALKGVDGAENAASAVLDLVRRGRAAAAEAATAGSMGSSSQERGS